MQQEQKSLPNENAVPTAEAEADHRIANNLALLNGVIRYRVREIEKHPGPLDAVQVGDMLRDLSVRVEAIGKLHKLLALKSDDTSLSLSSVVGEICTRVIAIFPPGRISLSMECNTPASIRADEAMLVGRIVAEMLTNAVKYAHPTGIPVLIHVTCRERGSTNLVVDISDDGVGLPEGFDPTKNGGLGFRVMRSTAAQLGGSVSFEQSPVGLRGRLVIPRSGGASESNVVSFPPLAVQA